MERFGIKCDNLGDFYAVIPIELGESKLPNQIIDLINSQKNEIFPDIPHESKIIDLLFVKEKYEKQGVYVVKSGLYFNNAKQRVNTADDYEFQMCMQMLYNGKNAFDNLISARESIGVSTLD